MKTFKRFNKISHLRQNGDSLKLKKANGNGYYYIEINPAMMRMILKCFNSFGKKLVVINNLNEVHIVKNEDLNDFTNLNGIILGLVYTVDNKKIVVFDKKKFHDALDNFKFTPDKTTTYNVDIRFTDEHTEDYPSYSTKNKKSNSIWTVSKPKKKKRFDWDEAYLEGLRIHGNIDDAEAHADDEEIAYKRRR